MLLVLNLNSGQPWTAGNMDSLTLGFSRDGGRKHASPQVHFRDSKQGGVEKCAVEEERGYLYCGPWVEISWCYMAWNTWVSCGCSPIIWFLNWIWGRGQHTCFDVYLGNIGLQMQCFEICGHSSMNEACGCIRTRVFYIRGHHQRVKFRQWIDTCGIRHSRSTIAEHLSWTFIFRTPTRTTDIFDLDPKHATGGW